MPQKNRRKALENDLAILRCRRLWLQKQERVIKAKLHEIWQDEDAPEAEEITMTSL